MLHNVKVTILFWDRYKSMNTLCGRNVEFMNIQHNGR
jgi:hypothetical protein